jgi:O-antigen/teichoic acid export membrane protein
MVRIRWRLEVDFIRRWFWSGLPFALTFVLTTLYFRIDVPILQFFRPDAEVGWYSAAYKPFEALLFLPMTMLQVVFPVLSVYHKNAPDRVAAATARFFKSLALLGWPVTVGTFLLAPVLTDSLHLFKNSEPALRILSLGIVFMFVNNAFIAALNSIDRQALFSWAALGSLIVNVLLNVVLIPLFGYLGASWATVLTEVALGVICWVLVARELRPMPVWVLSWRVLVCGLLMGGALFVLLRLVHFSGVAVLLPIAAGAAVYAAAVLLLRVADRDEMALARRALGRPG